MATWTYGYDGAGRVISVDNSFSETTDFTYDGEGKLLTQTNDNGTSREYVYNNQRGWPTTITYKQGSSTTMEYGLTYDSGSSTVGNLTGVSETGGATVSYEYDDLYRLTEEIRSSPSYTRTYGYDLSGNPTTINGSSFATFDSANKITQVSGKNVTSDNDGNITSIAATSPLPYKTLAWNNQNKATTVYPTSVGQIDYKYMYDGKRFYSKATTGMTSRVYYIFAGDTLIGEVTTSTPTTAYTWGPDGLISKRNLSTSTSHWYEFGPQGETRTLRNSSGTTTDTYYYNAYGEQTSSTGSTANPYRYGGKYGYYTESYTSLILATQRWYSPHLMRWVSRDPIGYRGGVNLYRYANNRPVKFIDLDGKAPGDSYPSMDEAARSAVNDINQTSIREGVEYAGWIYKKLSGSYSYTAPRRGTKDRSHPGASLWYMFRVGDYHTHGDHDAEYDNENFSPEDVGVAIESGLPAYLGTPSGRIKKFIPPEFFEDITNACK